jgi:predicted transcriptional regulator
MRSLRTSKNGARSAGNDTLEAIDTRRKYSSAWNQLAARPIQVYSAFMSVETVTFEAPKELIATIDEIAAQREVGRDVILRDALAEYLADYDDLQADLDEGYRQLDAGETVSHEEMVAWLRAQHSEADKSEAA